MERHRKRTCGSRKKDNQDNINISNDTKRGDQMAVTVTIRTSDGVLHTDPSEIYIKQNEKTEMLYHIVSQYVPKETTKEETA